MGSPLSPIIADITLQDLELHVLNTLTFSISFYFRYVDDIALAAPKDKINELVESFNLYHEKLSFTHELQANNQLNFLDLNITVKK